MYKVVRKDRFKPAKILALLLIGLIVLGTLLLKLPMSTQEPISWLTAFFTATSATTVTGLYVAFNGDIFTTFGNVVLLILIQLGGLGIISFAMILLLLVDHKVTFKQRLLIREELNQSSFKGIYKLLKRVLIFSFVIEMIVAFLLSFRFVPAFGLGRGLYYSIFHSISAFNNAGFSLWSDNLTQFVGDPYVNFLITTLVILGGLGFTVLIDVWENKSWRPFSLHTKLMLIGTLVINLIAVLLILVFEYHNPNTLGALPKDERFLAAYFQGIITRTAGFNTVDIGSLRPETLFLMILLMFIGAGSVSTGGGIKLTTFLLLIFMIIAYSRRRTEPTFLKRTIPHNYIFKALTVTLVSIGVICLAVIALLVSESNKISFLQILFEVASAFGTVGLSTGITPNLSVFGQLVIAFMMIFGKLGPLTILYSLAKQYTDDIKYPHGRLFIG